MPLKKYNKPRNPAGKPKLAKSAKARTFNASIRNSTVDLLGGEWYANRWIKLLVHEAEKALLAEKEQAAMDTKQTKASY